MQRAGSRNRYYVRRIPRDVQDAVVGLQLAVPVGEQTQFISLSSRSQSVRLSLRTDDPIEVKLRQARIDSYLESIWQNLRANQPLSLSHKQATALAGELYRAWADGAERERTVAVEHVPGVGWQRIANPQESSDEWDGALAHLEALEPSDLPQLEKSFGPLVDRLLIAKGVARVDEATREIILVAFLQALHQAFESRRRNAAGDYSPDPKGNRFPVWVDPSLAGSRGKVSLTGLLKDWWVEAKAVGRKPSTYESYKNTVVAFVAYLGHDDPGRVTRADVVGFKDHRLSMINPRTGRPISAKTVKDSDLSGLKTIFGWARANGKVNTNPAEGVTIKLGKPRKLRSKGFTDAEAEAVLSAALQLRRGQEKPKTFAAKRWVPWLCAYTGARVGELAQLRKEDIRREGSLWIANITPDAGTVKNNEARDVVLHEHLVELGFIEFVKNAESGHLFITPSANGDVEGPLQGIKNRIAEFVRTVVPDKNVAPNHAWRHRFKTVGIEAGIEHRILDAIQGHTSRTIAEGYGDVTIKSQAAAISKLPRYTVVE